MDVGFVSAHSLTKILGRNAALVFYVTFEAVFPLVVAATCLALPRLSIILMLKYNFVFLAAACSIINRSDRRSATVERIRAGPSGFFLRRRCKTGTERGFLSRNPDSPLCCSRRWRWFGSFAAPNRNICCRLRLRRTPGRVHRLISYGNKVRIRPKIKTFELDLSVTATQWATIVFRSVGEQVCLFGGYYLSVLEIFIFAVRKEEREKKNTER